MGGPGGWIEGNTYGCGSKIGTQNGKLVNGKRGLKSAFPWWLNIDPHADGVLTAPCAESALQNVVNIDDLYNASPVRAPAQSAKVLTSSLLSKTGGICGADKQDTLDVDLVSLLIYVLGSMLVFVCVMHLGSSNMGLSPDKGIPQTGGSLRLLSSKRDTPNITPRDLSSGRHACGAFLSLHCLRAAGPRALFATCLSHFLCKSTPGVLEHRVSLKPASAPPRLGPLCSRSTAIWPHRHSLRLESRSQPEIGAAAFLILYMVLGSPFLYRALITTQLDVSLSQLQHHLLPLLDEFLFPGVMMGINRHQLDGRTIVGLKLPLFPSGRGVYA